ncbi:hypothetical protein ES703_88889 [subsurface metagenome]
MSRGKRKSKANSTFGVIADFAETVDTVFERFTGKTIASCLKEFQQRPQELPPGGKAAPSQSAMPLADAYMVLGLPKTATLEEVKRNYKHLAAVFHPDKGGYTEAMVLLNNAYDTIKKVLKSKT